MILKTLHRLFLYSYIFYVIYTPIFSGSFFFNKYALLSVLTVIMLLPYIIRRNMSVLKVLSNKYLLLLMYFVFASSIYVMLVQVFNGGELTGVSGLRLIQNNLINIMIINAAIILDKLKALGYNSQKAFELLLKFGALQGLISLAGLLSPAVRQISVHMYGLAGGSNEFVLNARIYGISGDYTFGTPIYHGLLAGLAFYTAIRYGKKYYGYIVLILLATLLNGRTGILAFIIVSILSVIYMTIRGSMRKTFSALAIFLLTLIALVYSVKFLPPATQNFITSFYSDTNNLIVHHQLTGNYEILNDSFKLPSGNGFSLGEGHRVYQRNNTAEQNFRSDVGYVNDLFMGGVFFALLLYSSFFAFLLANAREDRFIFLTLFLVTMLANIKGEIFRSSIVMFLLVFVKFLSLNRGKESNNA